MTSDNEIQYVKIKKSATSDQLIYELCSTECPQSCARGMLSIDLGDPDEPKTILITPGKQDGKNDVSIDLENLKQYPNNRIVIFIEWGDLGYEKKSYSNDWNRPGNNNRELPQGIYYFHLSFFDNRIPDVFG